MKVPIVFIIYKRIDTTKKVFKLIHYYKPKKLYLIADGPKVIEDNNKCSEVRNFVEDNIDWDCELIKVYSDKNLGCAKRIQTGLDYVFESEEMAIILEDDTLPDPSFFSFCEELLERYNDDMRVTHISGCNLHSNVVNFKESYCFSSIVNIWGWATWKRAWMNYDISMQFWNNEDKDSFISNWCPDRKSHEGIRKMFDLHCNNEAPGTWDYQWTYACWKMNGLSVVPARNLVSNIGIGPDATHTKSKKQISLYPKKMESISFPLKHSHLKRNRIFELLYYKESRLSILQNAKLWLKRIINPWKQDH